MKIVKETQLDYYKVFGLWLIINLFLMFPPLFCYELFFDFSDYPGHDIPWYYIRRDFVKSFILSFGLIPTIIFGTIFIKTKKSSYFASIYSVNPILPQSRRSFSQRTQRFSL